MKKISMMGFLALTVLLPNYGLAGSVSDYLIMQDIGSYKFVGKGGGGQGSGILAPTGHFSKDHTDESYGSAYINRSAKIGVNVEVTKHTNSDSDKWLQHELDIEFRNYYGTPEYYLKNIDGNTIYVYGAGGRDYRWLSGNKVIMIEYHDSQLTKPEPLEIIQAYLAKHPSTLPVTSIGSKTNKTAWIKDEMDRRLWLCDKWFMQLQLKKAEDKQVYQESVKSMNVFLDYREKYYGLKAADEKNLLAGYMNMNNGTGIKAKLAENKNWWSIHKGDSISIQ